MKNVEEYWLRRFITHDKWIKEAINNIEASNKLLEDRRKQIKRLRACYKPGDLVLVKVFNRRKLDPFFTGPLEIVKQELNTVTPQGTYNCQKDVFIKLLKKKKKKKVLKTG